MKKTEYIEKLKSNLLNNKNDYDKKLFDYQNVILQHMINEETRGLLLYWTVGSGKTMISVSICEYFRKLGRMPIIISPKSLQDNFVKTIDRYTNNNEKALSQYIFASSNSPNLVKQMTSSLINEGSNNNYLTNKVIIVDEAHSLFNSITNGSKIASEFYSLIMNSKNIKLLLLSGTPIVNNFFEIVPAINMCTGYIGKKLTILPEFYDEFIKYFVDKKTLKNTDKFQNRIFGLVSYYGDFYYEKYIPFQDNIKLTIKKENFPDRLPIKIIKVSMSPKQNGRYLEFREMEKRETKYENKFGNGVIGGVIVNENNVETFGGEEEIRGGAILREKNIESSSYRIRSRQVSNILLDEANFDNIKDYSPKFSALINNMNDNHKDQLGLIYSNFLEYGIIPISKLLSHNGYYDYFDTEKPTDAKCYALFSGKIDIEVRNNIINIFNSKNNMNGSLIELLLVSSVGSKGLNLKRIRHLHIMESNWSYTTTEQIIGRGIRYKSHDDLPEDERNVAVYQYLADYNKEYKEAVKPKDQTSDLTLFYNSLKQKELNDQFLLLLAETAIDCDIFNKKINFECYNCIPDNNILFHPDVHVDMKIPNPCKKKTLNEVIYNDEVYYYSIDDDKIELYKKNNDGMYYTLKEQDKDIIDIINSEQKISKH